MISFSGEDMNFHNIFVKDMCILICECFLGWQKWTREARFQWSIAPRMGSWNTSEENWWKVVLYDGTFPFAGDAPGARLGWLAIGSPSRAQRNRAASSHHPAAGKVSGMPIDELLGSGKSYPGCPGNQIQDLIPMTKLKFLVNMIHEICTPNKSSVSGTEITSDRRSVLPWFEIKHQQEVEKERKKQLIGRFVCIGREKNINKILSCSQWLHQSINLSAWWDTIKRNL